MEELGEDTSELADGFSKYAAELKSLTGFDIMVEGSTNQFKDLYDIFEGIANVWDTLSSTQQARVSEILGGTRQLQVISSIVGNWGDAASAYATAMESAGVATQANATYMDSITGRIGVFKATFQEISKNFIDSDFVKNTVDFGTGLLNILNTVAKLINSLGGLKSILAVVGGIILNLNLDRIKNGIISLISGQSGIQKIFQAFSLYYETYGDFKKHGADSLDKSFKAVGSSASVASLAISGVTAALTIAIALYSRYKQMQEERRRRTLEAADNAKDEIESIEELTESYNKSLDAYKNNQGSIEDLEGATDSLLNKFGYEVNQIDTLISKYGSLDEAIRSLTADSINSKLPDLFAGVNENEGILTETANKQLKGIGAAGNNTSRKENESAYTALRALEEAGFISSGMYSVYSDEFGRYSKGFDITSIFSDIDTTSVEGVITAYNRLDNMMQTLISSGITSGFVYDELYNHYSALRTAVDGYTDALGDANKAVAQKGMLELLEGKELPQTKEEFDVFRSDIIQKYSDDFRGSTEDIEDAVDSVLSKEKSFADFYKNDLPQAVAESTDALKDFKDAFSEDIAKNIDDFQSNLTSLKEALTKLHDGSLELNDVVDLIQKFPQLATYVDLTDESFGDLDKGLRQLIKDSPDKVIDSLKEFKETNNLTEEAAENIDVLCEMLEDLPDTKVEDLSENFGILADNINASKKSLSELDKKLAEDDYDKGYQERVDKWEDFKELIDSGAVGSKAYTAYKDYYGISGLSVEDTKKWIEENNKYFQEGTKGVEAFLSEVSKLDKGKTGASYIDGVFEYDPQKLDKLATALGLSAEIVADLIGKFRMYSADFSVNDDIFGVLLSSGIIKKLEDGSLEADSDALQNFFVNTDKSWSDIVGLIHDISETEGADIKIVNKQSVEEAKQEVETLSDIYNRLKTYLESNATATVKELTEAFAFNNISTSIDDRTKTLLIEQDTIDSLLDAGASLKEILELIETLQSKENIKILPHLKVPTTVGDYDLDSLLSKEDKVADIEIKANIILDDEEIMATVETTSKQCQEILGDGWEAKLSTDASEAITDTSTVLQLLKSLPKNTSVKITPNSGVKSTESTLGSIYNSLLGIDKNKKKIVTVEYRTIGKNLSAEEFNGKYDRFARGTKSAEGGLALLGDQYSPDGSPKPELVVSDGEAYLAGVNGPVLSYLKNGDVVYNNADTKKIIGNNKFNSIPAFPDGGTYNGKNVSSTGSTTSSTGSANKKIEDSLKDTLDKISDALDEAIGDFEHKIFVLEKTDGSTAEIISIYKEMQNLVHQKADEYRSLGLDENSDYIQALQKQWWEYADAIDEVKEKAIDDILEIVQTTSNAVDEIENVISVLETAANEYSENNGFISIDTFQEIVSLGSQYMQYLTDENGLLVINQERINAVLSAKTRELAVEEAMAYVERLRLAINKESAEDLNELLYATQEATDSTWGLVYANLSLLDLNGEQYQAALNNINTIRSLADNAVAGVGQVSGAGITTAAEASEVAKKQLNDMKDGIDEILDTTIDMIKQRIEDQVDSLEDMKKNYQDIINLRKEALKMAKQEADYEDKVKDKVSEIAKLQSKINALSLDDSRDATAQRIKLEEEMNELQKELSDEQSDYAINAQENALDSQYEAFATEKDREIERLNESVSSYQKVYDLAINEIQNHWNTLYQTLIDWNYEYGNKLSSDITTAWQNATAAAEKYGSFVNAMNSIDSDIETLGDSSKSTSSDAINNTVVGKVNNYDVEYSDTDMIKAIVNQMKNNSALWAMADDDATRRDLSDKNMRLGMIDLAQYGIKAVRGDDGVWYIDKVGGVKLYEKYHSGGIVGGRPTLKQNEVMTVLEKGEAVLDEKRENSLYKLIDFMNMLTDKMKSLSVGNNLLGGLFRTPKLAGFDSIAPRSNTITFGDVYITGTNEETVQKHREITRQFTNEVIKQLNIKR